MFHQVARVRAGRLLFRDWVEAARLWADVIRLPTLRAAVLMPNHVHVLTERDVLVLMRDVSSAHARRLNHLRGRSGQVFEPLPPPQPVTGALKVSRNERYIHLNPCRKGLCDDPLAWPFSTHRDRVGLAYPLVVPRAREVDRYHAYVSSDPHVRVDGTELPVGGYDTLDLFDIEAAVSAATRTPLPLLRRRGPARSMLLRCARALTGCSVSELAARLGVGRRTVLRHAPVRDDAVRVVERIAGDARFAPLDAGDRRRGWGPYSRLDLP